jgi:hypothetical protein
MLLNQSSNIKPPCCSFDTGVAVQAWADRQAIRLDHSQRGKPQQNPYEWMDHYKHHRPYMALGGFTPKQRLDTAT